MAGRGAVREPGRGRAKSADGGRPGGGRRHGHDGPLGAGERACDGICSDCFVITVYVQEEFWVGRSWEERREWIRHRNNKVSGDADEAGMGIAGAAI